MGLLLFLENHCGTPIFSLVVRSLHLRFYSALLLSRFILIIIDKKLITVLPGSNFKFTLYLSYLVIGVTFTHTQQIWGIVFMVISKLPGAITDNRQRIKAVNHWESRIATKILILLLHASNLKICNFLIFCQIFMIFFYQNVGHYVQF